MECTCMCSNCKGKDCHYSGYHCHHWIRRYGDLESYGVCLVQMLADRPVYGGTGPEQQDRHDAYMSDQIPWYVPERVNR